MKREKKKKIKKSLSPTHLVKLRYKLVKLCDVECLKSDFVRKATYLKVKKGTAFLNSQNLIRGRYVYLVKAMQKIIF